MDECVKLDCSNKDKCCHKCYGYAFYKQPKQKKALGSNKRKTISSANESWRNLETQVAKDLSKIPKYYEAYRQYQSGAQWFAQGDVADPITFIECKEREGNISEAKGTKSFTIQKEWLDKSADEAKGSGKPVFLPFRFKSDDNIHVVTQWDGIYELVTTLKSAMIENEKKDVIIKDLLNQIERLNERVYNENNIIT